MQVCHKKKYKNSILRIVKSNLQPLAHFIDYDFFKLTHTQREIDTASTLAVGYLQMLHVCLSRHLTANESCQKQIRSRYYYLCDTFFIIQKKAYSSFVMYSVQRIYSAVVSGISSNLISRFVGGKLQQIRRRRW